MHELMTNEKYSPPKTDKKETKKASATITEITEEEEEEEQANAHGEEPRGVCQTTDKCFHVRAMRFHHLFSLFTRRQTVVF